MRNFFVLLLSLVVCAEQLAEFAPPDEELIPDPRGSMSPSQMVEEKLRKLLEKSNLAIPVSQLLQQRPRRTVK